MPAASSHRKASATSELQRARPGQSGARAPVSVTGNHHQIEVQGGPGAGSRRCRMEPEKPASHNNRAIPILYVFYTDAPRASSSSHGHDAKTRRDAMKDHEAEDLIELGAASSETRGPAVGMDDTQGGLRLWEGLSDE
jgi:hypothetical protein